MVVLTYIVFFFFFSSRRRHTRSKRDWSSDVCSSDLRRGIARIDRDCGNRDGQGADHGQDAGLLLRLRRGRAARPRTRSEERRVGKECRSRGAPEREKKKKSM